MSFPITGIDLELLNCNCHAGWTAERHNAGKSRNIRNSSDMRRAENDQAG
jgi:hypothetical protein